MKKALFLTAASIAALLNINATSAPIAAAPSQNVNTAPKAIPANVANAMKVAVPQKDLETAVRSAREGDILVYAGNDNWYQLDGKALQQGTRIFVLGTGSLVSVFPKDADGESYR